MKTATALLLALAAPDLASPARAQDADTILLNGKIVTLDSAAPLRRRWRCATARSSRSARSADIRALAGPATRVIDLARPHRHPRPDRFAHARDPRRRCSTPPR